MVCTTVLISLTCCCDPEKGESNFVQMVLERLLTTVYKKELLHSSKSFIWSAFTFYMFSNMWAWISAVYFRSQRKQKWSWNICNKITLDKVCKLSLTLPASCVIPSSFWASISTIVKWWIWTKCHLGSLLAGTRWSLNFLPVLEFQKTLFWLFRSPTFLLYYFTFSFLFHTYMYIFFYPTVCPLIWTFFITNPVKKSE